VKSSAGIFCDYKDNFLLVLASFFLLDRTEECKMCKPQNDPALFPNTRAWSDDEKLAYMTQNKGLIISLVKKYSKNLPSVGTDIDDLKQEAEIAYWIALGNYDPNRGVRFSTYVYKCMSNAINELYRIADADKRRPKNASLVPYDSIIDNDGEERMGGDNEDGRSLSAMKSLSVEDSCIQKEMIDAIYKILNEVFSEEERFIFLSLAKKEFTQMELAKMMHCSQAKISMLNNNIRIRLLCELELMGFEINLN